MRILVLTKRQYTGKDLLDERFGRLFEIPAALSEWGHDVRGIAISYRKRAQGAYRWTEYPRLSWRSENALPLGLLCYNRILSSATNEWMPDVVWSSGDMLQCTLAFRWTRECGLPLVIDLYDNYESFGLSRLPGLAQSFRVACREAEGVTTVGSLLAQRVEHRYRRIRPTGIVQNGARKDLFVVRDRLECRRRLGLPLDGRLVGTAGAINDDRGISDLFEAFLALASRDEQLWLVHAGVTDSTPARFRHPRIVDLGVLPLEQVPFVLSALDVGVVCNRDSEFGRYCMPLKLFEMLSTRTPVVAAEVGEAARVLAAHPECLYEPGNSLDLAGKIEYQLSTPQVDALPAAPSWADCARGLEAFLMPLVRG